MIQNSLIQHQVVHLQVFASAENGLESWKAFPKQLDADDFVSTLDDLFDYGDASTFCLFYDRATIHTSKKAKLKIIELHMEEPIRNLTAQPILNGSEAGILCIKNAVRAAKLA